MIVSVEGHKRMFSDSNIKIWYTNSEEKGLCVIEAQEKLFDPFVWVKKNKQILENILLTHGGILLRNFNLHSIAEFNKIVQILSPELLDYIYRSTPRTKLGGKIYTATEYPADKIIPLHNENAYSKTWPKKIFFFSAVVAAIGGETPIADSRNVYKRINMAIRKKFEEHGVLYVRNYTKGIDLSWQDVFQTEEKREVEKYCKEHNIEIEWKQGTPELTTRQKCQATIIHPINGEPIWFNQAHLFHISSLLAEDLLTLIEEIGEENLPRNAFYGNSEPIGIDVLEHIRECYEKEKITFKWKKGDVMILDNILMAHGREAYEGERKIAVAMA